MVTTEELDDGMGAALGARLHDEMADVTAPPGLAATVRRRRAHQRWALSGALVLPVVAAGVAVALAVTGTTKGVPPGPAQAGGTQPRDVAYVVARSEQALDAASGSIVHVTTTLDGGNAQDAWADPAGQKVVSTSSEGGTPRFAYLMAIKSDRLTILSVDYARQVWWLDSNQRPGKVPAGALGVPYGDPAEVRAALAGGDLVLVGSEQVDGHATEHLRLSVDSEDSVSVGQDLWVDATSYLPVKLTGHKGPNQFAVGYEWLPRTPENVAKVALTPPAGFTEQPLDEAGNPLGPTPSPKG
ncbi:MAG TPA: hypothetical protein VHA75_19725 [Rugosimonospora sp.]|nr:hypothetical protein [Rugosimonospora sp.]